MAEDRRPDTLTSPASSAVAVTPSDSVNLLQVSRALYVGTGGDVAVEMRSGATVTFKNVADGQSLALRVVKVLDTGTSASDIVAIW
ncbi:MAG: hypothetical protein AAFY22_05905 [Pseudomonadota bacterium]